MARSFTKKQRGPPIKKDPFRIKFLFRD